MDLSFYKEHGWVHIPNIIPPDYLKIAQTKGPNLVKWGRSLMGKEPALAGPPNHLSLIHI